MAINRSNSINISGASAFVSKNVYFNDTNPATAPTTSNYGPSSGSVTPTSWAKNVIQLQGVYILTKPY